MVVRSTIISDFGAKIWPNSGSPKSGRCFSGKNLGFPRDFLWKSREIWSFKSRKSGFLRNSEEGGPKNDNFRGGPSISSHLANPGDPENREILAVFGRSKSWNFGKFWSRVQNFQTFLRNLIQNQISGKNSGENPEIWIFGKNKIGKWKIEIGKWDLEKIFP